jgi:hypothetical protein
MEPSVADLRLEPNLSALVADPALALRLRPVEAATLLARVEGLAAILRLAATTAPAGAEAAASALIGVDEAAHRAGVSREQFLRRRAFRPAIVRQGHRTLRVNAKRLERVLAQMEP